MQLNKGQEAAVTAVFQFLMSSDKELNISGPAGVGKTFMMKHIMEHVLKAYQTGCDLLGVKPTQYEVVLTATTNKAAEVLATSTGFPTSTIHSFLKLKVYDDFKTGQTKITASKDFTVNSRKLIFIDEASMVDSGLYDYLHKGTDSTCKIIYLGDDRQLAPVQEKLSKVYQNPKHFVELTEPMRNAEQPALMALCSQLRDTVKTLQFHDIVPVPGVIEYLDGAQAQAFVDRTFATEGASSRILCYTNNKVKEYNNYIRNLRGYPNRFSVGEILINNSGVQIGAVFLRVEQEVIVHSVSDQTYIKQFDDNDPNSAVELYDVVLTDKTGNAFIQAPVAVDQDHFHNLIRYYARAKAWSTYYALKNNYPDLRPKDGATVYKSQGSTYDSVLLDLSDIGTCTQNDQLARMLYVGASRAKSLVFLYGRLPARLAQAA